jgi:hypothetical protein
MILNAAANLRPRPSNMNRFEAELYTYKTLCWTTRYTGDRRVCLHSGLIGRTTRRDSNRLLLDSSTDDLLGILRVTA